MSAQDTEARGARHIVVEQDGHGRVSERRAGVPDSCAECEGDHENEVPVVLGRGEYAIERDRDIAQDEEDGAQAEHGEVREAAAWRAEIVEVK